MADLSLDWENAKPSSLQSEWDNAIPQEATASQRVGATTGGINKGIAGLLGLPVDTAENLLNLGKAGVGTVATALGRPDLAPEITTGSFGGSQSIARGMNKIGVGTENPRPDDTASRLLNTGGMIAGGSMIPGAGLKSTLTAATGGAIAGETLGPEWTAVGALAPAAASQAVGGIKNAISAKVAPNVETFKQAGTMPSVGQATDSAFLHGLENLAAKFPGGAGVMRSFVENQQKQFGLRAKTGVPTDEAGRAIEKGVTGTGGFLERTKKTWNTLDDAVAAKIPKGSEIQPINTLAALDELTAASRGAEATSGIMTNPKLRQIYDAFKRDMAAPPVPLPGTDVPSIYKTIDKNVIEQPQSRIQKTIETAASELHPHGYGQPSRPVSFPKTDVSAKITMPYQTIRELRSKVGSMIDNELVSGIPGGELKRLYGALSKDLEAAAINSGAGNEFKRQNNYYRARMDRIESVLDRVIGKGKLPEDIFKTFYPTDPDQANKVRSVMRSLEPSERQVVTDAVVNRLGRASPSNQMDVGEVFSSETFLTNWRKLSPGARSQLFPDPPVRDNVEKLAKAAANIRSGRGIYANPSGTAGSFAAFAIYTAPMTALGGVVSGTPGALAVAGTAAASAATANLGARMLTSPKVVEWLAKPVNPSNPKEAVAHLARLGVIYNNTKDEKLKEELGNYIKSVQQ